VLKACHTQALAFFSEKAKTRKLAARENLEHILEMSDIDQTEFERSVEAMKCHAQVALHFHPDRLVADGQTVAESLLKTGRYKSQFETGISAGSVSASPGGFRWEWEDKLFGRAYSQNGVEAADRPKYGALNLMLSIDGPAPRFGSCYILLQPQVGARCTFTFRDSHLDPLEKGTWDEFDDILCALTTEAFERNFAIGAHGVKPRDLMERFFALEGHGFGPVSRNLDHYIEAQVHGQIELKRDVTHLVADPSFQGHPEGEQMEELCQKFELKLVWRPGFELSTESVPSDFRGAVMCSFARRVAERGRVNARLIGIAARGVVSEPSAWEEFGEPAHLLQLVKRLWHTTVKFGDLI
jgi:hypothetical protein